MTSPSARSGVFKQSLGRELVNRIYDLTATFPDYEKYGLISQLRRASVSVPSNIAEGAALDTTPSYIHYLYRARGSCSEIRTQLLLSGDRNFASKHAIREVLDLRRKTESALTAQIKSLEN
jgi:four helix bundle protein